MSKLKYAAQNYDEKSMARARMNNVEASLKISVEIANMIRYKDTERAKRILEQVLDMKAAVPYRKFNRDVAHKTAIGPGRYPVKSVKLMLDLIKLAESNASNKGLSSELYIIHLAPNKGTTQWHHGRKRRTMMKSTNLEIVVAQKSQKKTEKKHDKAEAKKEEKVEHKEEAKEAPKKAPKKTAKKSETQ